MIVIRYGQKSDIPIFSVSSRQEREFYMSSNECMVLVEFLGANVLDEKPFIVMPYLANGNARNYLQDHPNADQLQIVCMSHVCIFVLAHFSGTCAAACHFSGTGSSPLTSDCTCRLES